MKNVTIAIACELTPGKTLIPIIKRLKELEKDGKLNWEKSKIIGLTHGSGVVELIKPYCDETYSIGEGRGAGKVKKNNIELGYLIAKDSFKALSALTGKGIDLLITCGNAGDVRKSITAAKLLRIPVIHIEQDIYNPIETIAYSNLITVPEKKYEDFLKEVYLMNTDNIKNICGYPMASYVNDYVNNGNLIGKEEIIEKYGVAYFILVVLGGDLKTSDLKDLIIAIEKANYPTLIAPYRFKKELIEDLVNSTKVKVLDEFLDLLSLMKSAKLMIYGAGMGMTIEAGVLEVPSIKLAGFHKKHGSVHLANKLNIPILEIEELYDFLSDFNSNVEISNNNINNSINNNIDNNINYNNINNIEKPNGKKLIENSQIAIEKVVEIINDFNLKNPPKTSGFKSMKAIWNQRSKYR